MRQYSAVVELAANVDGQQLKLLCNCFEVCKIRSYSMDKIWLRCNDNARENARSVVRILSVVTCRDAV